MQNIRRILSIDGGGIRGVIPIAILAYIEARTGKPISQLFDLVAGTSTGAILGLGLTAQNRLGEPLYTAAEICKLYEQEIPNIFRNPQTWLGNLLMPKYKSFAFQKVLRNFLGDSLLSGALTDLLIPCYDIEHRLPFVFKSRSARAESQCDFRMKDVALAASASPTLFHPVRVPTPGGFVCLVDGGVFANNPTMLAVAEMKSVYPGDDVIVVSIGTGRSARPLTDELVNLWGYVQWSRPMLELVMESSSESVHEQMQQLLNSLETQQYYRLQVDLPAHSNPAIDNASTKNIKALDQAAADFCADSKNAEELHRLCDRLLFLSEQQLEPLSR
jgi:uncharacterized protein